MSIATSILLEGLNKTSDIPEWSTSSTAYFYVLLYVRIEV
jgi:hypothetical protein